MQNHNTIKEELQEIFRYVLDNKHIIIEEHHVAGDIEGWDSLSHIRLVFAIEKKFGVRFASAEILNWKNIGEILMSLKQKLKNNNE